MLKLHIGVRFGCPPCQVRQRVRQDRLPSQSNESFQPTNRVTSSLADLLATRRHHNRVTHSTLPVLKLTPKLFTCAAVTVEFKNFWIYHSGLLSSSAGFSVAWFPFLPAPLPVALFLCCSCSFAHCILASLYTIVHFVSSGRARISWTAAEDSVAREEEDWEWKEKADWMEERFWSVGMIFPEEVLSICRLSTRRRNMSSISSSVSGRGKKKSESPEVEEGRPSYPFDWLARDSVRPRGLLELRDDDGGGPDWEPAERREVEVLERTGGGGYRS